MGGVGHDSGATNDEHTFSRFACFCFVVSFTLSHTDTRSRCLHLFLSWLALLRFFTPFCSGC